MVEVLIWVGIALGGLLALLVLAALVLEIRDSFRRVIPSLEARRVLLLEALYVAEKVLPPALANRRPDDKQVLAALAKGMDAISSCTGSACRWRLPTCGCCWKCSEIRT